MVRDPGIEFARKVARKFRGALNSVRSRDMVTAMTRLPENTTLRILWPVGKRYGEGTEQPSMMFGRTLDHEGAVVLDALHIEIGESEMRDKPRTFADAVAVAGVRTLEAARRRAVVLVLGDGADRSEHTPATVRRYLARIGVLLFVWSVDGPQPEWGDVTDIASLDRLHAAIVTLNQTLDAQRIVWLPVDPLTALNVQVKPDCGVATVASP
jgi:hypothetical protein